MLYDIICSKGRCVLGGLKGSATKGSISKMWFDDCIFQVMTPAGVLYGMMSYNITYRTIVQFSIYIHLSLSLSISLSLYIYIYIHVHTNKPYIYI